MIKRNWQFLMSAVLIMLLVGAGSATARILSMTGEWFMNRGPLIDIPINGGQVGCTGGAPNGCVAGIKPINGGIPGTGHVTVAGSAPASFTVPPNRFHQALGKQEAAVAINATVIQLATTFTLNGPPRLVTGTQGGIPAANVPARFMQNAWSNDPGQAARLAANFAWCPNSGGPACTAAAGGPGTNTSTTAANGMVTYTAGNNAFGGTMAMMTAGTGQTSVLIGTAFVGHLFVGAGATPAPQHPGRGYATFDIDNLQPGPIMQSFMTNPPCTNLLPALPVGCGLITASGPQIATIPADTNNNWGFPWTTGTVRAFNSGTNLGNPASTTLTVMGTDSRTVLGAGKITLVAGGTSHRVQSGQDFAAIDIVTLNIGQSLVPTTSPLGMLAIAALMILGVGYTFRSRLAQRFHG